MQLNTTFVYHSICMKKYLPLIPFAFLFVFACNNAPKATEPASYEIKPTIRNDFKKYYDSLNLDGTFALYDLNKEEYILYNEKEFEVGTTPASTFKICNSMIGLETGVIKDENFVIKWDGKKRWNENWNADTDLKTAYKNSTVWYYQELARRVGGAKMKYWLDKVQYGNADTTGGIDKFWLDGGLRISPEQQIVFLQQLYENRLPFSQRTMDITKQIMIAKDTVNFKLRAKTGWGFEGKKSIGWYVGYVEANNDVYFFANRVETADSTNPNFTKGRISICYQIFKDLGIYK